MVIKSLTEDILYILGHLDSYKMNVDQQVEPLSVVAIAGTTGNSDGVHLHLEARKCTFKKRAEVLRENANKSYLTISDQKKIFLSPAEIAAGLQFISEVLWSNKIPRVNPFNHGEIIQ